MTEPSPSNSKEAITAGFTVLFSEDGSVVEVTKYQCPDQTGRVTLKNENGLGLGIFVSCLFFILWNGMTLYFLIDSISNPESIRSYTGFIFFIALFQSVGIYLIVKSIQAILKYLTPRPHLEVEESVIPLGESTSLNWSFKNKKSIFDQMSFHLIGEEQATYYQGSDLCTDCHIFYEKILLNTDLHNFQRNGTLEIPIPKHSMHSWKSMRNEIRWKILFLGQSKNWSNSELHFPITVTPIRSPQLT